MAAGRGVDLTVGDRALSAWRLTAAAAVDCDGGVRSPPLPGQRVADLQRLGQEQRAWCDRVPAGPLDVP
ncbi:MAG: hypothetical protein U0531_01970 [Dehalococcoidia bacterium]